MCLYLRSRGGEKAQVNCRLPCSFRSYVNTKLGNYMEQINYTPASSIESSSRGKTCDIIFFKLY